MSFKRDELLHKKIENIYKYFLKASSVAGLITTIGKEAGKEAFNKTNNLYLATLLERVIIANKFIV